MGRGGGKERVLKQVIKVKEPGTQHDGSDRLRFAPTAPRDDIMGIHIRTSREVVRLRMPNRSKRQVQAHTNEAGLPRI